MGKSMGAKALRHKDLNRFSVFATLTIMMRKIKAF
jgi:hypothetical protein